MLVALSATSCAVPFAGTGDVDEDTIASTTIDGGQTGTTLDGATPGDDGDSAPDEPDTNPPPAPIAPPEWEICRDGVFECATVDVPLDYSDPEGQTIELALARYPATGPADQVIGTIFTNPGGPGGSGVDYVLDGFNFDAEIAARYHIVGFDPRGVGLSSPVACQTNRADGPLPDYSPDSLAEVEALDDEAAAVANDCATATGDDGIGPELLANVGTDDVARDLDLLREAVGDEKLHYYGFSYGTLIGLVYADLFPERVAHLGLDGVVDPRLSLSQLLDQQAGEFEAVFELMDSQCGQELRCPEGGVVATHDRLVARLEAEGPVGGFGQTEAEFAAILALYNDGFWPTYAAALGAADQGDTAGLERFSDLLVGQVSFTAYAAVFCSDAPHAGTPEGWEAFASQMAADHPRFGAAVANELRVCAHWPEPPGPARTAVTATGAAPALVVGNTNDPATPLINAVEVAAGLDQAGLIVVDANVHTGYRVSPCVQNLVRDYFLEDAVPTDVVQC